MKGKTMKKAILCLVVFLAGCETGYEKERFTGSYTDVRLGVDRFKVDFRGNAYIGRGEAEAYALLRCAELTLENGFRYFALLGSVSNEEVSSYTTPAQAHTHGSISTIGPGATFESRTTYSGGEVYNYRRPRVRFNIQCFKEKPIDESVSVYDAQTISERVRQTNNFK